MNPTRYLGRPNRGHLAPYGDTSGHAEPAGPVTVRRIPPEPPSDAAREQRRRDQTRARKNRSH